MDTPTKWSDRFSSYLKRDLAQTAAESLSNGIEIEFRVAEPDASDPGAAETFTFTKVGGRNEVVTGPAKDPQITFLVTPQAAEEIVSDTSEEIAQAGVHIMKLVISADPRKRVQVKFRAGFLSLWGKGYFGVLTAGGSKFASYLATRGLSGMGAIKAALSKMKSK